MAIAFVQAGQAAGSSSPNVTLTNTGGNLLVAGLEENVATFMLSQPTDSKGNLYRCAGWVKNAGNNQIMSLWYAMNVAAGSNTVHANSGSNYTHLIVAEYSGVATTNALDGPGGYNITSTPTNTFNTQSGDLIVAMGFGSAAGSGFTSRGTDTFSLLEDKIASGSTDSADMTGGAMIVAASFRPAGALNLPTYIQQAYNVGFPTNASSLAIPTSNPVTVTVGNLLVAYLDVFNATSVNVADTVGSTWTQLGTAISNGAGTLYVFWAYAHASGTNTVTFSWTGSTNTFPAGQYMEFSGIDPTTPIVDQAQTTGTSATAQETLTSTVANSLAVMFCAVPNSKNFTGPASSPWVQQPTSTNFPPWGNWSLGTNYGFGGVVGPTTSTGSYTPQIGISGSGGWAVNGFVLNPQPATYSISGNAGVAAATVSYTGTSSGSVAANGSGDYSITGLVNGSYTITPTKTSYTFTPTNSGQTVSSSNITGVNFTASSAGGSSQYAAVPALFM